MAVGLAGAPDGRVAVGVVERLPIGDEIVSWRGVWGAGHSSFPGNKLALGGDERLSVLFRGNGDLVAAAILRGQKEAILGLGGLAKDEKPAGRGFTIGKTQIAECLAAIPGPENEVLVAHTREWKGKSALVVGAAREQQYESGIVDVRVCPCCRPALAMRPDGTALVAYRGEDEKNVRDIFVRRRSSGAPKFGAPSRVSPEGYTATACPMAGPALLALDDRAVVVAYVLPGADPHVKVARSKDGGASFAPPLEVAIGAHPQLAAIGSQGTIALVYEGRAEGIFFAFSTDGGASFEAPIRVDEARPGAAPSGAAMAADPKGTGAYVAWVEKRGESRAAILRHVGRK